MAKSPLRTMRRRSANPYPFTEGGLMYNYDFGSPTGEGPRGSFGEPGDHHHGRSVLSLIVWIAVIAVVAALGLGLAVWAFGFLFSLVGWILRVAVIAGVAALIWRRVVRGRCRCRHRAWDQGPDDYGRRRSA
ncbi:MAG: hypothetical protein ACRDYY_05070 [Acidimicrobiales bacterium]